MILLFIALNKIVINLKIIIFLFIQYLFQAKNFIIPEFEIVNKNLLFQPLFKCFISQHPEQLTKLDLIHLLIFLMLDNSLVLVILNRYLIVS